jgi:hypothetical protein
VPALSFGNVTVEQDSRDDEILTPASTLRPQDLIFTILGTYVLPALARAGAARRRPAVPRPLPLPRTRTGPALPVRLEHTPGWQCHRHAGIYRGERAREGSRRHAVVAALRHLARYAECGGEGLILPKDVGTTRRRSAGFLRFVRKCIAGDVEGRRLPSRQ